MKSLAHIRNLIEHDKLNPDAQFFKELLVALERGEPVSISKMYDLNYSEFELTLEILRDWRLHRYSVGRSAEQSH
jgi:hypothetical protein